MTTLLPKISFDGEKCDQINLLQKVFERAHVLNEKITDKNEDIEKEQSILIISKSGDIREGSRLMRYLELLRQSGVNASLQRAIGKGYLRCNPFSTRTETEAICFFQEKSVHRVCFLYDSV